MLKIFSTALALLLLPTQIMATDIKESDVAFKPSYKFVELSDEILKFIPIGVKHCQDIFMDDTGRLGLLALSMLYYDKCLTKFAQKEQFFPDQTRVLKQHPDSYLLLYYGNGTEKGRISIKNIQNEMFLNSEYTINALRQITLNMIFHYFRLLLDVHYLSYGKQKIEGFLDLRDVEQQCAMYENIQKTKGVVLNLDGKKAIMDRLSYDFGNKNNKTMCLYFGLFFGLSPLHFLEICPGDKQFCLTELEFDAPRLNLDPVQLLSKTYCASIAKEMMSFRPKITVNELKLLAPLLGINYRNEYVRLQLEAGNFSKEETSRLLSNSAITEHLAPFIPGLSLMNQMISHARQQAKEEAEKNIGPLEKKVRTLEEENLRLWAELKALQAEAAKDRLLKEEESKLAGKGKNKKQSPPDTGQVEKLKKQLVASRKAKDELAALIEKSENELKEKNTTIGKLQHSIKELSASHNQLVEEKKALNKRLEDSEKRIFVYGQKEQQIDDMIEIYQELKGQIDCFKEEIERLQMAVAEAGEDRKANQFMVDTILETNEISNKLKIHPPEERGYDLDDMMRLAEDLKATRDSNDTLKFQNSTLQERSQFYLSELSRLQNIIMHLQSQLSYCGVQLAAFNQQLEQEKQLRIKAEEELKELKELASSPKAEGTSL